MVYFIQRRFFNVSHSSCLHVKIKNYITMDKVAFTICYYRHTITKKTGNSKIDKKNNYIYTYFCESHLISTTHMYFIIHTITKISENSEIAKITNYIYLFLRGRFNFKNSFVCFYNMFFFISKY